MDGAGLEKPTPPTPTEDPTAEIPLKLLLTQLQTKQPTPEEQLESNADLLKQLNDADRCVDKLEAAHKLQALQQKHENEQLMF